MAAKFASILAEASKRRVDLHGGPSGGPRLSTTLRAVRRDEAVGIWSDQESGCESDDDVYEDECVLQRDIYHASSDDALDLFMYDEES